MGGAPSESDDRLAGVGGEVVGFAEVAGGVERGVAGRRSLLACLLCPEPASAQGVAEGASVRVVAAVVAGRREV